MVDLKGTSNSCWVTFIRKEFLILLLLFVIKISSLEFKENFGRLSVSNKFNRKGIENR